MSSYIISPELRTAIQLDINSTKCKRCPSLYYLHGDCRWLVDGTWDYYCALCDAFNPRQHFHREHSAVDHVKKYKWHSRVFLNLACLRPMTRGCDIGNNLIERTAERERQRAAIRFAADPIRPW